MDIGSWLAGLGLGRYADAFRRNDVDADVLDSLTADDLREMGIASVGHRRRLLDAIAARRQEGNAAVHAPPAVPAGAERRRLTVMFVDLVGSTALSSRLDPEELGRVLASYRNAAAGEIARLEGLVAKFMGDGILAYFGWPRAHEDEAERAVRAGLGVRDAVAALEGDGLPLACRIGIATGLVVVGDLVGEGAARERTVVGDTPNLAARLQAMAGPGQVLVAPATRRLLGAAFDLEALGERELKGIERPIPVFAVRGERTLTSRFEARAGRPAPMVGRHFELAFLLDRWRQASGGEGQAALLLGEAGHGKSRIVRALMDALSGEPHRTVHLQCSPYHAKSALWPVIQEVRAEAALAPDDSPEAALDKLEALPAPFPREGDDLPLVAELLGLDGSARYGTLEPTPQARRARTLEALTGRLLRLARDRPLLVVLEDAHWIDPSTRDLIDALLERIAQARMLLLLTSRPESLPQLSNHDRLGRLSLDRLDRAAAETIVRRAGGEHLPRATVEAIVARTDGVPLFIEELTKAVLEAGDTVIPASLHDTLMARLDRIPEAKDLAQIAACIGREFDKELLAAIAGRPAARIDEALEGLMRAELVFRKHRAGGGRFAFKHALVRDAAYESLLRTRRREVHGRIAAVMVRNAALGDSFEPELIARHFLAADDPTSAIPHLLRATDVAIARAAGPEAQETIRTGLAAVADLPPTDAAIAWQARFHLLMGDSLRSTHGTAAAETGDAYRRARLAFARTGDQDGQEMALFGEFLSHFNAARLDRADEVAGLLRAAPAFGTNPARHWHKHEASGLADFVRGRFASARRHLEALPDADGPYPDRPSAGRIYLPWSLFVMGWPDRAFALEEAALENAAGVGRKFMLVAALGNGCYLPQLGGRVELLAERARRCVEESRTAHLRIWESISSVFLGWLAGRQGDPGRAEALMVPALRALEEAGHRIELGYLSSLRADILLEAGRRAAAGTILEEALARNAVSGERWFDAELHRMLAAGVDDASTAERHLEEALRTAQEQQARLFELRAARDLARLRVRKGEPRRALDLLSPILEWFEEGFATPDLIAARSLLDELRPVPPNV